MGVSLFHKEAAVAMADVGSFVLVLLLLLEGGSGSITSRSTSTITRGNIAGGD
jgi:hypothetical protein